jgi:preprotein translocase subunit YajC
MRINQKVVNAVGIVGTVTELPNNKGEVTVKLENGKIEKWLVGAIKILGVVDVVVMSLKNLLTYIKSLLS